LRWKSAFALEKGKIYSRGKKMVVSQDPKTKLSPQWASVVDEITRRIVATAHPQRILLFGSMARGQSNADSDLDMLVIVRGPVHRRKIEQQIYANLHGITIPVDVVVATEEDINKFGDRIGSIYRPALREGKVVYEV
jgi:predicted nucleotidyltransferase